MTEEKKEVFEERYEKLLDRVRNKPEFSEQLSKLPPETRERFEKEMAEFLKKMLKKLPNINGFSDKF